MTAVLTLAVATGLTPYDASYLWLARRLGLPLVTLDQTLARAADAVGRALGRPASPSRRLRRRHEPST